MKKKISTWEKCQETWCKHYITNGKEERSYQLRDMPPPSPPPITGANRWLQLRMPPPPPPHLISPKGQHSPCRSSSTQWSLHFCFVVSSDHSISSNLHHNEEIQLEMRPFLRNPCHKGSLPSPIVQFFLTLFKWPLTPPLVLNMYVRKRLSRQNNA